MQTLNFCCLASDRVAQESTIPDLLARFINRSLFREGTMGRIKTKRIKRYTRMVMKEAEFSSDFAANKKVFMTVAVAHSKKIRNIIAGYAARLARRRAQSE